MSYLYQLFNYLNDLFVVDNQSYETDEKDTFLNKYPYELIFFPKLDIYIFFFFKKIYFFFHRTYYRLNIKKSANTFLYGFFFLIKHVYFWILPLIYFLAFFYFSIYVRSIPFLKVIFEWFIIFNLFYWLISGFVFFVKKYRYNRYTAAIQRFWRRTFILFWLVESSLFVVFIYLLFNASQEPVYIFDMIQLTKTRLYSWKFFIYRSFFFTSIIILAYLLLLNLKWNTFNKLSNYLIVITVILTYIVWLEFYQFFYVINWYGEIMWVFDTEDKVWYAESVFKRARIVNHYVTICVIAKFWHIIYIYIFWVFFVLRSLEHSKISYVFLSANLQNFIILYIMNWLLMYPWLKFIFRKWLTFNHKSFHEFRDFVVSGFYCDFWLFVKSTFKPRKLFKFFKKTDFYYSGVTNSGVHSFSKQFMQTQMYEIFLSI